MLDIDDYWGEFEKTELPAWESANERSYLWDKIVERAIEEARRKDHYWKNDLSDRLVVLRELASSNRVQRRALADELMYTLNEADKPRNRVFAHPVIPPFHPEGGPSYVFMVVRYSGETSHDTYRQIRMDMLMTYCRAFKVRFPAIQQVIGFATESGAHHKGARHSEDFFILDLNKVSMQEGEQSLEILTKFGFQFLKKVGSERHIEFPASIGTNVLDGQEFKFQGRVWYIFEDYDKSWRAIRLGVPPALRAPSRKTLIEMIKWFSRGLLR